MPQPSADVAELEKRNEFLLTYARTAFDTEHHRYEWSEVKISRYLTVITVVIGLASVRLPELIARLGHPSGAYEWIFVITYCVSAATGIGALLMALLGLTYVRVPNIAIGEDLVMAVRDNPLSAV